MAAKLAEDLTLTIGVVEAGTFYELSNGNNSQIPGLDIQNAGKDVDDWQPGNDWGFVTAPQEVVHRRLFFFLGGEGAAPGAYSVDLR